MGTNGLLTKFAFNAYGEIKEEVTGTNMISVPEEKVT